MKDLKTLGMACKILDITRPTLAKRMAELGIQKQEHPGEGRVRLISDKDIARIRERLDELAALRASPVRAAASPARSAPVKRPERPASPDSPRSASQGAVPDLPAAYVTVEAFAEAHGVPKSTVMQDVAGRWRRGVWKPGKNETGAIIGGPWHVDRNNDVRYALDADGRRRFVEKYRKSCAAFHENDCCPHK